MPNKQFNILLDEDHIDQLEKMAIKLSLENSKKCTVTDIVRRAIDKTVLDNYSPLNVFYEVVHNGDRFPNQKLRLNLGDKEFHTEIGCFEVLISLNQLRQVEKVECNFLLKAELMQYSSANPSLFFATIPSDLLEKKSPYEYTMSLTTSTGLESISRFNKYFEMKYLGDGWQPISNFSDTIKEIRTEFENLSKTVIKSPPGVYETLLIPELNKFRCCKFKFFPNTAAFGTQGWIFNFQTTQKEVVNSITYNMTIKDCHIEQIHSGSGDNNHGI